LIKSKHSVNPWLESLISIPIICGFPWAFILTPRRQGAKAAQREIPTADTR